MVLEMARTRFQFDRKVLAIEQLFAIEQLVRSTRCVMYWYHEETTDWIKGSRPAFISVEFDPCITSSTVGFSILVRQ